MYKIFTLIYLICSIYATGPSVNESAAVKCLVVEDPTGMFNELLKLPDINESLKKLGYIKDERGDSSLLLRNAVLRFQSDNNIEVNGIWDKKYSQALIGRLLEEEHKYPDTVDTPPADNYWITINKTKRILTLYKGEKAVSKYPVAIGKLTSITPEGKFSISSKVINPTWGGGGYAKPIKGGSPSNPLGYRWMGLSLKGGSRYGIHGNNSPYSIGKNISHGCIRLINHDVEELFEIVPVSAPVWIGSEKLLGSWGITQPEYTGE